LGLGNQVLTSTRGVIIWQGVEIRHNTGTGEDESPLCLPITIRRQKQE